MYITARYPVRFGGSLSIVRVQLISSLYADTAGTTEGTDGVISSGTLNIILLSGLAPEDHDGDTRHETAEQAAQDSRLA